MEPKTQYNSKVASTVIPDDFEVPFGKARIRHEGSDLTIVTYGNTTHFCLDVAKKLAAEGKTLEVIDLRSLVPLDEEAIYTSLAKTNRCLIVHEDKVHGGFGGELVAKINEHAFDLLDAPVKRVGSPFMPVGFNRILERAILPNSDRIESAVREMLNF